MRHTFSAGFCAVLATALLLVATPAVAQEPGLLFALSGDHGLNADVAGGDGSAQFADLVSVKPNGVGGAGHYIEAQTDQVLAWSAPGNIYAQRGTLSFFWRARDPVGETEFPIFRVGYADHTSWDMVFLRIDWNGHGFDAFVTDTGLARERVSYRLPAPLAADQWVHIAFAWDENTGVRLYINGALAGQVNQPADLDAGLSFFGPHSRIISPYQVQSSYLFRRGGDVDEIRIYDRMLDAPQIAALARNQAPALAASTRSLAQQPYQREWLWRYGWTRAAPPVLADAQTRIRRVEFADARDVHEWMWKGNDGIRETTWPGVYNRSRLPGRADYFILPDWNVYSFGGRAVTYTLPDEAWNRLEIQGAAAGRLSFIASPNSAPRSLGRRAQGEERTTHALASMRGGAVRFDNDVQEVPIEEIGAYNVSAGAPPQGVAQLTYTVRANASADYPELDELNTFIAGRYMADERTSVVAIPQGAPSRPRAAAPGAGLPIVHVLIPYDFSASPNGTPYVRFGYSWANMNAGLDGIALDIPALHVSATHGQLYPLNIRVKDPLWPARDLVDINVSVRPNEARTIFLDTRDRILPDGHSLYLTIAGAGAGLDAAALDGMRVRLIFKDRAQAAIEHVHDRLEQVRDNYGFIVEEHPTSPRLPLVQRLDRDLTDLLRVDPGNAIALSYLSDWKPEVPYPTTTLADPPQGVPLWAFRQVEDLSLVRRFVQWWITERQVDGEFGGGLSDDVDLTNQWPGLYLMGDDPAPLVRSHRDMVEAIYRNGMLTNGIGTIQTDELHSYEEGINALSQAMYMDWGEPRVVERMMETARSYARLTEVNSAGHRHFVSNYYGAHRMSREGIWEWSRANNYLILHPGLLLVEFNNNPAVKQIILDLADGYLAHGRQGADGAWSFPSEINWRTDQARGSTTDRVHPILWAAYRWTGDAKYLAPLEADLHRTGPTAMNAITADAIAITGKSDALRARVIDQAQSADDGYLLDEAWRMSGDTRYLDRLYTNQVQRNRARMYMVTEGHMWSDRVELPSNELQRERLGGIALIRNGIFPGHAVSWRFDAPDTAEHVAILVPDARPNHLRIVAYNMNAQAVGAELTGWEIAAGRWRLRQGPDANNDGQIDAASTTEEVTFEASRAIRVEFPAHTQSVIEMELIAPAPPVNQRADVGIGRGDVRMAGGAVLVTVHSLGSTPAPAGRVIVEDASGHELASAATPALAAPLDLLPKTAQVRVPVRGALPAGARVRLVLETPEITQLNNSLPLN